MPVTLDLTEVDIFTTLRAFLLGVLPAGIEVVRGQDNRVPEPAGDDYVVMTSNVRRRLGTNVEVWDETNPAPVSTTAMQPTEVTIQCDVHGPNGADNAQIITTLFRSSYAVGKFSAAGFDLTPLHASDPKQVPFTNGEQQFEDRWAIDMMMEAKPVVTVDQDFANTLTVDLVEVDTTYPA